MRSKYVYILSKEPYIIAGSFGTIDEIPSGPPVTLLYHLSWWLHPVAVFRLKRRIVALKRRRSVKVIVCTNERREAWLARAVGLSASWHNHNIHVNEAVFRPLPDRIEPAPYQAVYAATLKPYKRLQLASEISKLFVVTYVSGMASGWDLHVEYPMLAHAHYNNKFLTEEDVNIIYNSASCGLALSRYEGAMYSSMEYMLAGLPVVSTKNAGGRNQFRTGPYWEEVSSTSQAIAQAVERVSRPCYDRNCVRNAALGKVQKARLRYVAMLRRLGASILASEQHELDRIWGYPLGLSKHKILAINA